MVKILKFYTDACPACKLIEPFLEEVANENDDIEVEEVHAIDDSRGQEYGIMTAPVLIFLNEDGDQYGRLNGYANKEMILKVAREGN